MANKGGGNQLLVIMLMFLGAICVVFYVYLLWSGRLNLGSMPTSAASSPQSTVVELWEAYERARAAARTEASDVQFVSASTQWEAVSEETLLAGPEGWSFTFYSPAESDAIDVVVDANGAQVINRTRLWIAPPVLDPGAWQAGPQDPLLVFLAHGGRDFLGQRPQALVDLHLGTDDEGRLSWTIVALHPGDQSTLSVLVDAETMEVLRASP